jgi:mono/diheme cytochrome c family protein
LAPIVPRPRPLIALAWTLLAVAVAAAGVAVPTGPDGERWAAGRRAYHEAGGTGCAVCHGEFGANELGLAPVVRGADAARIHASLAPMETMTFLQGALADEEIDAMAYYLEHLATMQPLVVTRRRAALHPAAARLPAGAHVQLILVNQDRGPCTWTVSPNGAAPVEVAGRATGAVDWMTGSAGDELEAYCVEEPDVRVQLRIE